MSTGEDMLVWKTISCNSSKRCVRHSLLPLFVKVSGLAERDGCFIKTESAAHIEFVFAPGARYLKCVFRIRSGSSMDRVSISWNSVGVSGELGARACQDDAIIGMLWCKKKIRGVRIDFASVQEYSQIEIGQVEFLRLNSFAGWSNRRINTLKKLARVVMKRPSLPFRLLYSLVRSGPRETKNKIGGVLHREYQTPVSPQAEPLPTGTQQCFLAHPTRDVLGAAGQLAFSTAEKPLVSVIIPVYNKVEYTLQCLVSVIRSAPSVPYEVIIIDDGSSDETAELVAVIPGIRYLRNKSNLGFLKSVNEASRHATGEFLLLLNNDTCVMAGWMDELVMTYDNFPNAGVVGSRLVYADSGVLQECGNFISQQCESIPIGRGMSPDDLEFSYCREVDFCSGASLMIRRSDFEAAGRLDERYAPAYYEDPDIAFAMLNKGKRNYVQPLSRVVHYESVSHGWERTGDLISRNREKFRKKWAHLLATRRFKDVNQYLLAGPSRDKPSVLYIDACIPVPDRGAGSVDAFYFLKFLVEKGYRVVFVGEHNPDYVEKYTPLLQRNGIMHVYRPVNVREYLAKTGQEYVLAYICRVYQAISFKEELEKYCFNAKVIFNTVDIHFLRETRQAEVENSQELLKQANKTKVAELDMIRRADATIVISEYEKEILEKEYGLSRLWHIPLIREIHGCARPYGQRKDYVFIGSAHLPNVDATCYFHEEIWPLVKKAIPEAVLIVIGEELRESLKEREYYKILSNDDSVHMVGFVEDLATYFDDIRVMVSPLRYGSGVKGKIATSLAYGVPVVSSNIGIEGMGMADGVNVLVGETPEEFAAQCIRLYNDENLWNTLSGNGLSYMKEKFSLEAGREKFVQIINDVNGSSRDFSTITSDQRQYFKERQKVAGQWAKIQEQYASLCRNAGSGGLAVCGECELCGPGSLFVLDMEYSDGVVPNFRERFVCSECGLNNRQRFLLGLLKERIDEGSHDVYLLEQTTMFFSKAAALAGARCTGSEYLGGDKVCGAEYAGIRHEDCTCYSFQDMTFDVVVSQDVFEHVPDIDRSLAETFRILRDGGVLLMTVPFDVNSGKTVQRAMLVEGEVQLLCDPVYHANPVSEKGSLVYYDFGWDLLDRMRRAGFKKAEAINYFDTKRMHIGSDLLVFRGER